MKNLLCMLGLHDWSYYPATLSHEKDDCAEVCSREKASGTTPHSATVVVSSDHRFSPEHSFVVIQRLCWGCDSTQWMKNERGWSPRENQLSVGWYDPIRPHMDRKSWRGYSL